MALSATDLYTILAGMMAGGQNTNPILQALQGVTGAQQATGETTPYTQAAKSLLQSTNERGNIDALTTSADQKAYQGDYDKNPQAIVPFLQGQEKSLDSKRKAAAMQWRAAHGPDDKSSVGKPLPDYLQEHGGKTAGLPSYMQEGVIDFNEANPQYADRDNPAYEDPVMKRAMRGEA